MHRGERPLVIGHRGAGGVAPGNSREGLAVAVEAGADLVEFDLGADLRLGHRGDTPKAPPLTLAEALTFLAAHPIGVQVDLKCRGIESEVVSALRASGLLQRAAVSSTWGSSLRLIAGEEPTLALIIGYPRDRTGAARLPWPAPLRRAGAAALRLLMPLRARLLLGRSGAGALALHHALVSPAVLAAAHARGAALVAWTVNEPARIEALARIGVDAIVSDDPGMALDVLATLSGR